jgi:ribose 5-phosphate isomerase A
VDTAERVRILAEHVAAQIPAGKIIGLGTGSTTDAVLRALGQRKADDPSFAITGVSTSVATAKLAESLGFTLRDLADVDHIDLGYDGADEIDPALNVVKGRGGALLYEKLIAEICADYWIVSTDDKLVDRLGTRLPLPVEIIPYGWNHTTSRLEKLGLMPVLRKTDGVPYRTDAGNYIVDCTHQLGIDLLATAPAIKATTGVVEHGIFPNLAHRAILVDNEGSTRTICRG